jgi:hypothetical protein
MMASDWHHCAAEAVARWAYGIYPHAAGTQPCKQNRLLFC